MEQLLLHPVVQRRLDAYLKRPGHAVQLIAPAGFGKGTIATELTLQLLGIVEDQLHNYAYFRRYTPEKNVITIETARDIIAFLKLKTTGDAAIRRVIIIESADAMTPEAQNAVLKLLEEPPSDTVFILTVTKPTRLLATIDSRTQRIALTSPDREATISYFQSKGHDQASITSAYLMSGGLTGLMSALLATDETHALVHAITQAKEVLKADTFERLTMIDEIAKNKQIDQLLFALKQTSQAALAHAAAQPGRETAVKRWHSVLHAVHRSEILQASNAQPKLLLTDLFLSL